jgi:hypothetical protein
MTMSPSLSYRLSGELTGQGHEAPTTSSTFFTGSVTNSPVTKYP